MRSKPPILPIFLGVLWSAGSLCANDEIGLDWKAVEPLLAADDPDIRLPGVDADADAYWRGRSGDLAYYADRHPASGSQVRAQLRAAG